MSSQPNRIPLARKLAIFFFGIFIIGFNGYKYFERPDIPPGQRSFALSLYYAGIVFWVLVFSLIASYR